MKLTITSTEKFITLDGVHCRVWEGVTEGGVPCFVFVHRIAVDTDRDTAQFERELMERLPPAEACRLADVLSPRPTEGTGDHA